MLNKQPVQLSPALQALMVLQQQANPVAPNGQPTIAGQMAQKAQQGIMQPMMASAPSMDESQGIAGVLDQVRGSMPSVQQNAQNAQAEGIAQRAAQIMQKPKSDGVAGLAAPNMGFAEGGVIGYDGEDGSYVEDAAAKDTNGIKKALATALGLPAAALMDAVAPLSGQTSMYDRVRNYIGIGPRQEAAIAGDTMKEMQRGSNAANVQGISQLLPPQKQPQVNNGGSKVSASVRTAGAAPSSSFDYNKIIKDIMGGDTGANEQDLKAAQQAALKVRNEAPPVQQTAADALKAALAKHQGIEGELDAQKGPRQLAALLAGMGRGGLGGAGERVNNFKDQEVSRQRASVEYELLNAKERSTIEALQQAQKVGNADAAVGFQKDLADIRDKKAQIKASIAGPAMSSMGHIEAAKIQAAAHLAAARLSAEVRGGTKEEKILALRERLYESANKEPEIAKLAAFAAMPGKFGDDAREKIGALRKAYIEEGIAHVFGTDARGAAQPGAPTSATTLPQGVTVKRVGS